MTQEITNTLYEMDNLEVLRGINSNSIDLIATDLPFNTKWNRSGTAGFSVDKWKYGDTDKLPDQWKWNEVHPKWLETIQDGHRALYQVIEATKVVQGEDTDAFLCFISVRLLKEGTLIDLGKASEWTWQYLVQRIQETPHQYHLNGI